MFIYLDLETTGLEEGDRICSVGVLVDDAGRLSVKEELIKPPRKIRPEAMAVHHITNEMVKGANGFENSDISLLLTEHNRADNTLVAHNTRFDLGMLAKEGFVWQGGIIDTLKCSKHLIDEIDLFSLQYLRYELGLYRREAEEAEKIGLEIGAHRAQSDAFHVMLLHRYLNEMADDSRLQQLSTEPALIRKLSFGKHKGSYLEEVAINDAGYLRWMLEQDIDDDIRYSIEHYLGL